MASAKTSKSLHVSYNQHILECLIEGGVGGGGGGWNKQGGSENSSKLYKRGAGGAENC